MIRLVVVGAAGRMGRAVVETAAGDAGFELAGGLDRGPAPAGWNPAFPWFTDIQEAVSTGTVVVEFSSPAGAVAAARACAATGAALVSGSTGLGDGDEAALQAAAERIAVLRAANFSLGVLALRRAVRAAVGALPGWDVEIVERHHRGKKDSPSGTALRLAADVAATLGVSAPSLRHGREGNVGPRPAAEIGLHAVRGGTWVGDHTVLLAGSGEWLELRHVAQDRTAFARGALAAAGFVARAPAGLYAMDAVET